MSGTNLRKMMCNNSILDIVNINAYMTFGEILSIRSQLFSYPSIKHVFWVLKRTI